MRALDILNLSFQTLFKQKFKTLMLFFSISIGVVSVVLLTGLGQGGRGFVLNEFSMLGNQTLVMVPGKKQTEGGLPPLTGDSVKPITVADAFQLKKLAMVSTVAPLVIGTAEAFVKPSRHQDDGPFIKNEQLSKVDITVLGSNDELVDIMNIPIIQGRNLSTRSWHQAQSQVLLGVELKHQLFANQNAVGKWIRLADRRYQVIGVMKANGTNLGLNFNKMAVIPVRNGMTLFNKEGLFRVFIKVKHTSLIPRVTEQIISTMKQRQGGIEDVTVVSQNAVLQGFDDIMLAINLAVAGIGVISLIVAGILIMNVTLISVSQRTKEIGLLRAIGASKLQIQQLFMTEAGLTAFLGSLMGLLLSFLLLYVLRLQFPDIPFYPPLWAVISSSVIAISCALGFAYLPARRAAKLAIIAALNGQMLTEDTTAVAATPVKKLRQ